MTTVRAERVRHVEIDSTLWPANCFLADTFRHLRNVDRLRAGVPQARRDLERPGGRKLPFGYFEQIPGVCRILRCGAHQSCLRRGYLSPG